MRFFLSKSRPASNRCITLHSEDEYLREHFCMIFISGNQSEIYNSPFPKVGLDLYFYVHSGFTQIVTRIIQSYYSANVRMLHFSCGRKSDMERAWIIRVTQIETREFLAVRNSRKQIFGITVLNQ